MTAFSNNRFFDVSTLVTVLATLVLLISLPGGCWSEDTEAPEEVEDTASDEAEQPTPPPMMEIVEPDPSAIESESGDPASQDDHPDDAGQDSGEESENDDGTYVVQPGDTLFGIAVHLSVSIDALMEENGIADPNELQVGQVLQVP